MNIAQMSDIGRPAEPRTEPDHSRQMAEFSVIVARTRLALRLVGLTSLAAFIVRLMFD